MPAPLVTDGRDGSDDFGSDPGGSGGTALRHGRVSATGGDEPLSSPPNPSQNPGAPLCLCARLGRCSWVGPANALCVTQTLAKPARAAAAAAVRAPTRAGSARLKPELRRAAAG